MLWSQHNVAPQTSQAPKVFLVLFGACHLDLEDRHHPKYRVAVRDVKPPTSLATNPKTPRHQILKPTKRYTLNCPKPDGAMKALLTPLLQLT